MRLLTVNCGSSSIKCAIFDNSRRVLDVTVERIGSDKAALTMNSETSAVDATDHAAAMRHILDRLAQPGSANLADAVVHRIVHGGARFVAPTLIADDVVASLSELADLAPLHSPPAIAALRLLRQLMPEIPHLAVFDTSFHTTLPPRAREYALPTAVCERHGIRRYGFHGISHSHVMEAVSGALQMRPQQLRIISCHLGNGEALPLSNTVVASRRAWA